MQSSVDAEGKAKQNAEKQAKSLETAVSNRIRTRATISYL